MPVFYPDARVVLQVVFETYGEIERPKAFPVRARSISIHSNAYNEADTFQVELDANDFPFSPELIRAGACEIYLFSKAGLDDAPSSLRSNEDPEAVIDGDLVTPSIVGLFDESDLSYDEEARIFTIEGRDYTSLFLDKQYVREPNAKGKAKPRRIPLGKSLHDTISDMIDQVPGAKAMRLISSGGADDVRVGSGVSPVNKKGIPLKSGASYWEAITMVAKWHGFIVFVRGLDVVLTLPKDWQKAQSGVYKVAWGKNLTRLSMRRKIGKERVPVIVAVSYDEHTGKTIVGKYPKKGQKAASGLGTERDQIRQFTLRGITSKAQLDRYARTTYEQLSRAELEVELETHDLTDLEGSDVMAIRAGDAVGVQFDQFNADLLRELSYEKRVQVLVSMGYAIGVAREVGRRYEQLEALKQPLRVREATLDYSVDSGISIRIEAVNFVNVGDEVDA